MVLDWDTTSSLPCYRINALTLPQLGMRIKLMNTLSFHGRVCTHLSTASTVGFGDFGQWGPLGAQTNPNVAGGHAQG